MDVILFLTFAVIAVVCAINVVVQTHPISSALSLVGVMGSLAVIGPTRIDYQHAMTAVSYIARLFDKLLNEPE